MNWGKSIVLAFILFAAFIGVLVTVCVRQDISLVSKTYYQEELAFEAQMDRQRNTEALIDKPEIQVVEDRSLKITFAGFSQLKKGRLNLYSPGDATQDRTFSLQPTSASAQIFSIEKLRKGKYIARMTWTMHEKEFYYETTLYL
ncbi:MAG TPA: FixH family protein [Chryseolinea sp.]